jgi:hypothetical protein
MSSESADCPVYPVFCRLASNNDSIFNSFKTSNVYNIILENLSYETGSEYINCFKHNKIIIDNINKFKINDTLGRPKVYEYEIGWFSPTTLQYIKILSDLLKYNLNNTHIIEIGPGYGGQYTILRQLFKPIKYTFIDLDPVLKLIKKYVSRLGLDDIELEYINYLDLPDKNISDLVISNFSISECDYNVQDKYISSIINHSAHGYILHNNLRGYDHIELINKLKNNITIDEKLKNIDNTALYNTVLLTW